MVRFTDGDIRGTGLFMHELKKLEPNWRWGNETYLNTKHWLQPKIQANSRR